MIHFHFINFSTLPEVQRWPAGLLRCVLNSQQDISYRFLIVDNSSSTVKKDCHHLVDDKGTWRYYHHILIFIITNE